MTRPAVHAGNPCSLTGLKQNAKQRWAAIPPRRSETLPASHRKLNTSCFYLLILLTNANICSLKSTLTHNRRHKITLVLAALTQNQQGHTFKALKPDFTVVTFKHRPVRSLSLFLRYTDFSFRNIAP